jgi:ABC-type lipoprotein release transport system permease subunit
MSTLFKIAWLNIWRNPRRTVILLCAMMAGLVGVLISMGLTAAWMDELRRNAVQTFAGHVKVLAAGYFDNPIIEHAYTPIPALAEQLDRDPRVRGWAERVAVQGLLSTAARSRIVTVVGVEPQREVRVSGLKNALREGTPLDAWEGPEQPILIGRRLADRLERGLGKKVVLMSQQYGSSEVGSGAFRMAGVFESGNSAFDEQYVYIRKRDAQAMLNLGDRVTETVVVLNDIADSGPIAREWTAWLQEDSVEFLSWKDQLPFVVRVIELSNRMMVPYYAIFYTAMAFGIVNTLLMAIGERTHEIGVMMAIGMKRSRLVFLILLESLMIAAVATLAGTAVGCGIVSWLGHIGIDLTSMAEAMAYMGMSRVVYPRLSPAGVAGAGLAALLVALVFSVYPAYRASRLLPVEAIREIA